MNIQDLPRGGRPKMEAWIPTAWRLLSSVVRQESVLDGRQQCQPQCLFLFGAASRNAVVLYTH